jgi:glucuronoarabinoxylan endo-1,4-beta-xylanase
VTLASVPTQFTLGNYPNPFNASTVISYKLPGNSQVTLKLFDVLGREVATLVDEAQSGGDHLVRWDASRFSSGVYLYRLTANDLVQTRKMVLLK